MCLRALQKCLTAIRSMRILPILSSPQRPSVRLGSTPVFPFVERGFYLKAKELKSHIHCIGLSGAGKSKLLASYASQLILQGQAVGVVDPHADLAHDILALLMKARYFERKDARQKLLYIDFSDRTAALPFNVLRQAYPVDEVARLVVEACTRAWPALADGNAPNFENVLLASIPVLIANDLPITEMTRLLADRVFRERLLRHVSDPQISSFFHDRFDQWGKEAPLLVESVLRRVFLLSYSPALRYALCQRENALNFRQLLDEQVSVIFNLGGLDEETQKLLGCLVTVGYEVAALSRADMLEELRTPYSLVLDEFASFSAQSEETLARVLSLTRKYGLFCVLAHQTFSQLSSRLAGALQNTMQISFRVGREDAVWAAPRFGSFDPKEVKHVVEDETAETRTHPVFVSVQEAYEGWAQALESLKPREAFVRIHGKTVKLRTLTVKHRIRWEQIEQLRNEYALQLLTPRESIVGWDQSSEETGMPSAQVPAIASNDEKIVSTPRVVPLDVSPALSRSKSPRPKRVKRPKSVEKSENQQMAVRDTKNALEGIVGPLRRGLAVV